MCAARNGYWWHCNVYMCSEANRHELFSVMLNCTDPFTAEADLNNVQSVSSYLTWTIKHIAADLANGHSGKLSLQH